MKQFYSRIFVSVLLLSVWSWEVYGSATPHDISPVTSGLEVRKPATPGVVCVYPNLGGDKLYLEASCPLECVLLDEEGRVLLDCTLKIGITLLDTSKFESGRYILKAGTETFTIDI